MTFPNPFIRVTLFGHWATDTSEEIWSTSFKLGTGDSSVPEPTVLEEALTESLPAAISFHTNGDLDAGSPARLTELQAAVLGTDGKYVGTDQITTVVPVSPTVQGTGTTLHPYPTAQALTLQSQTVSRGRGSRNRMFYPAVGHTVGSDGRFEGDLEAVTIAAKAMIFNFAAQFSIAFAPLVITPRVLSGLGAGSDTVLGQVSMDDIPDHIERRENALIPERFFSG